MEKNRLPKAADLLLAAAAFVLSLACAEAFVRALPISDRLGWNRTPTPEERVRRFEKLSGPRVVCLGDSYLEWRAGSGVNFLDRAQKELPRLALLNLGRAGTDVDRYVHAYDRYVRFDPDLVVIFLYIGNDVHFYPDLSSLRPEPPDPKSGFRQFMKRHSVLLNTLFRMWKVWFVTARTGTFEKNLAVLKAKGHASDEALRKGMNRVDPRMLDMARSDAINPITVAEAVATPGLYKRLLRAEDTSGADATLSLIRRFRESRRIRQMAVVLIPESIQVSERYDDFFRKCGYDLDDFPLGDRRRLNAYLAAGFQAQGIRVLDTVPFLEGGDSAYIENDTHWNAEGHRRAAGPVARFIESYFEIPKEN